MHDPTSDAETAARAVVPLRRPSARAAALGGDGCPLVAGPGAPKMMGDARSELFHYEVRVTYDTPEVAESRRIVEQARQQSEALTFEDADDQEDEPWRDA